MFGVTKKLILFFAILSAASGAEAITTLQYSDRIPSQQKELLNSDLLKLQKMTPVDSDGELKRLLKLDAANAVNMDHWLAVRAHYVVEEAFKPNDSIEIQNDKQIYPANMGISLVPSQTEDHSDVRVVMSNLGASIYMLGKQNHLLLNTLIPGVGSLRIQSPRVGLLQIGEGLFQPIAKDWPIEKIENEMHTIWRLTTLFHEARHSDGHGKSLIFSHSLCPEGHDYYGKFACDEAGNGAYRIGAVVMKSLTEGCQSCSKEEKDVLSMLVADQMNRILVPIKHSNSVDDLCKLAAMNGVNPSYCKNRNENAADEWDDAPEQVP